MLRTLCRAHTPLSDGDITQLEQLEAQLPLIAELTGGDVFIDCVLPDGLTAVVVAEAKPRTGQGSVYIGTVVGKLALPANEPAVFRAYQSGMPVRDLKALTQENISVKQDVTPIRGQGGAVIGLLIKEKDITQYLLQERKYQELAKTRKTFENPTPQASDQVAMREVHHRIKNNLQTIASILSMQARKSDNPETRAAFRENVSRVLSIAAIHDILTVEVGDGCVEVSSLLDKVRRNIQSMLGGDPPPLITVTGSGLRLPADKASALALCVNELIMNAAEHAFVGLPGGNIQVQVAPGQLYNTITITDDGCGFDIGLCQESGSMGLAIVQSTVQGKLDGSLKLLSDENGTCAMLEFKNE